jgi:hypothetical protein
VGVKVVDIIEEEDPDREAIMASKEISEEDIRVREETTREEAIIGRGIQMAIVKVVTDPEESIAVIEMEATDPGETTTISQGREVLGHEGKDLVTTVMEATGQEETQDTIATVIRRVEATGMTTVKTGGLEGRGQVPANNLI